MPPLTAEEITPDVRGRFFSKTEKQDDGCYLWKGMVKTVHAWMYPMMTVGGVARYAREIAWFLDHPDEPVPKGGVSPSCGNYLCVAPQHMVSKFKTYVPGILRP